MSCIWLRLTWILVTEFQIIPKRTGKQKQCIPLDIHSAWYLLRFDCKKCAILNAKAQRKIFKYNQLLIYTSHCLDFWFIAPNKCTAFYVHGIYIPHHAMCKDSSDFHLHLVTVFHHPQNLPSVCINGFVNKELLPHDTIFQRHTLQMIMKPHC